MESVFSKRVTEHLEKTQTLISMQHGFRSGRSSLTTLLRARECWTEAVANGILVHVIFIDFSNMLDKVLHFKLMLKLGHPTQSSTGFVISSVKDRSHRTCRVCWQKITKNKWHPSEFSPRTLTVFATHKQTSIVFQIGMLSLSGGPQNNENKQVRPRQLLCKKSLMK